MRRNPCSARSLVPAVLRPPNAYCARLSPGEEDAMTRIANKPSSLEVGPDTSIVVTTAGAGGYGPPAERGAEALAGDRRSGKFSDGYLAREYGASGGSAAPGEAPAGRGDAGASPDRTGRRS